MRDVSDRQEPTDIVNAEEEDGICRIVMNHPQHANCLSAGLVSGILDALDRYELDRCRVVVLRAYSGAKVWSAGHDMKEIPLDGEDPLTWNVPFERLLHRVRNYPVPVIGMIEGSVWGGACDLAMSCDLLVGCDTARFAITPAKIGLPYNAAGLTHFLGVLPLHIVKEMLFTAEPLNSQDAYRLGVLNRLVSVEELEQTTLQIAGTIAQRAPKVVRLLKAEMKKLTSGPALNPDDFEEIQELRREAYSSQDFQEGVHAFFERRTPVFIDK
jgi:methylmalonyl-CoA decarboxylase